MAKIFGFLDGLVDSFMEKVFEIINNFWADITAGAGSGAYISILLISVFLIILILVGLVRVVRKFGFFIFLVIITVVIPVVWFLFVK